MTIPSSFAEALKDNGHVVNEGCWADLRDDGIHGMIGVYTCVVCGKTYSCSFPEGYTVDQCDTTPEFRAVLNTLPDLFNALYKTGVTNAKNNLHPYHAQRLVQLTLALSWVIKELVNPDWKDIRLEE